MTISLAIAGASGRMGRALLRSVAADARFRIVGGTVRQGSPALGVDLGVLGGGDPINVPSTHDARAASAPADVWIDFTTPDATEDAIASIASKAAVIGTTGLSAAQDDRIARAAEHMPIVKAGNFSLGVTLLAVLVEDAARRLGPEWDIEIHEAHHRRKLDAPSGTALMLGEAAARGRGSSLNALRLPSREGATAARREGGIGFAVTRSGGIVGEHDVSFAAEREVLTLSHKALDRALFADGALAAAAWVVGKPPGLYSMRNVLGF